jgi:starch synthase
MKILMISSEGPPLMRSGALADVLEALPRELKKRGHEVALALPFYREIRTNPRNEVRSTRVTIKISLGRKKHAAEILECFTPSGLQVFLIKCDEFFDRAELYAEHGDPYPDNAARFIFFSKSAVALARRMTPSPEILHTHDWTTALVPVLVRDQRLPFATMLTIHHLAEQGNFPGTDFGLTNLAKNYFDLHGIEFFGRINLLKGGILFADKITTASERYSRDIRTPAYGCGLDAVLRENANRLVGILNGADYARWNPATDKLLPITYGPGSLQSKQICSTALLNELNLAPAPRGPVFGMVTRLAEEKGFEILMPLLDRLLSDDVRLIILGEGDPAYETALAIAARKYATKFAYRKSYDETLAHLIEGGMDITLIPSRFEPSGLSAMHSLKYGSLPIARATGGVHQIIEDYDPAGDSGYGFLYYDYSSEALWDSIKRAREIFRDRPAWNALMERAMARDFSWEVAVERYEAIYAGILGQSLPMQLTA